MKTPIEILTELQEIAPHLGKQGIYRIPYSVPTDFFEDFTKNLMERIRLEEMDEVSPHFEISEISPVLAELKNKNPYQVPAGYFEALKTKIPALETSPATVNLKRTPVFNLKVFKYAVAAGIAALLGTAVFTLNNRKISDPIKDLTTISDQDMANYLDSDDIHWTPGLSSSSVSTDFNENDVQDLLSGVPDEELEQYSTLLPDDKRNVN